MGETLDALSADSVHPGTSNLKFERQAEGHPVLFQCSRKIVSLWGAYELQHRYRKALFGQALFEEFHLKLAERAFE